MPIIDQEAWDSWVEANSKSPADDAGGLPIPDGYGGACIKVAHGVMEILDEEPGDFDTHEIICRADRESEAGGITGFMAGCVAVMVAKCHSRGDEFRRKWNVDNQISGEGERANEGEGVLNPALLNIELP